jgi:hypothetical protein
MSMEKVKKPTSEELFELFLLALQDEEVKLAGDIGGFKDALYQGFKDYTYRKKYTEEMLFDYIDYALESILGDDQPMQQTDYTMGQNVAGL